MFPIQNALSLKNGSLTKKKLFKRQLIIDSIPVSMLTPIT